MKNLIFILFTFLLVSCGGPESTTEVKSETTERAIGFNSMLPDLKFHLGTEAAVDVVKELDKHWAAKEYDAMRSFFTDTTEFYLEDGQVLESTDEFIEMISEDDEEDVSWTFDYAFSVDLDPTRGGEHVQAGFTVKVPKEDGTTVENYYHESYYVVDGKIVSYRQYSIEPDDKEESE